MRKLILLAAMGLGYVLGAKAGHQRYEDIKSQFLKVKNNPTVQDKASQAADAAKQQAPVVKDKVVGAASAAAAKAKSSTSNSSSDSDSSNVSDNASSPDNSSDSEKFGGSSDSDDLTDQLNPDSTVHQGDDAYPKGDLP